MSHRVSLLLFSGRPDPTWDITEAQVAIILKNWSSLVPATGPAPSPPPLGYRGCRLTSGPHTITAWSGWVVQEGGSAPSVRQDPQRQLERQLLGSAPPGLLSPEMLRRVLG